MTEPTEEQMGTLRATLCPWCVAGVPFVSSGSRYHVGERGVWALCAVKLLPPPARQNAAVLIDQAIADAVAEKEAEVARLRVYKDCLDHYHARFCEIYDAWREPGADNSRVLEAVRRFVTANEHEEIIDKHMRAQEAMGRVADLEAEVERLRSKRETATIVQHTMCADHGRALEWPGGEAWCVDCAGPPRAITARIWGDV